MIFVIFDSLDGNGAYSQMFLRDIPSFAHTLIQIFSWNFGNIAIDLSKVCEGLGNKMIVPRLRYCV